MLDDFLDISGVQSFGHYVTLVCPFHESYPVRNSLFVWSDWWKCQSCGKQGKDHEYLLRVLNSGSTIHFEQKRFINPWNNWIRDYGSVFGACKKGYNSLKSFPQQKYYLIKRGIPENEIERLKLGYLEGYYIIPMLGADGGLSGAVCRKGESFEDQSNKYITPKGQDNKRLLYVPGGWKRLEAPGAVYLTFGILSSISVYLQGKTALSGTTLDSTALDEINVPIYIIPDFKEEAQARKLADKLGWRGKVLELKYSDKINDPNDYLIYNREKELKEQLDDI